jgi:hypothetical protein
MHNTSFLLFVFRYLFLFCVSRFVFVCFVCACFVLDFFAAAVVVIVILYCQIFLVENLLRESCEEERTFSLSRSLCLRWQQSEMICLRLRQHQLP